MHTFKFQTCPVCDGSLRFSRLTCEKCKAEYPINEEFSPLMKLDQEKEEFLLIFLKTRGNIKMICEETGLSYPTIKRKLDQLLNALDLGEPEKEMEVDLSKMNMQNFMGNKPSDVIKRKLYEAGGKVTIPLLDGKPCTLMMTEDGRGFLCDKLAKYKMKHDFTVFDLIVDLLKASKNGRARKGCGHHKEDKVGFGKCTEDTVMGTVALRYYGKQYGDSTFDPVFVLAAVLDWAGIAQNRRGYLQLLPEDRREQ